MNSNKNCLLLDLPLTDYTEALELQQALVEAKVSGRLNQDVLILLEHRPVFTLGLRGGREFLLVAESFLRARGIPLVPVRRGGYITYHGPGQLIAYPIVDLKTNSFKVVSFVEALEETMIRTAADFGVTAGRNPLNRGVWVGDRKLGSVGIAIKRNVTHHGLALNVNNSLEPFGWINPCGLHGVSMVSMKEILNRDVPMDQVRRSAAFHFTEILGKETAACSLAHIYGQIDPGSKEHGTA